MFVYWPFFSSRDLVFISTFMLLCLELEKFSLFYDTYSSIFPVHKLRQTELTNDGRSKWRLWPLRPAVSCTRGGADWPKVVAVGAQQPISDFLGIIQMRDTLSTNGEHLREAEVKSFPAISKSMRSVNGDQNGANLKKWSVLLARTIRREDFARSVLPLTPGAGSKTAVGRSIYIY